MEYRENMEKPKTRANSKGRIIDAAFENFSTHGYDGASLSVIAEMVGIRKASIYTHFDSKDALFLALLQHAFELESAYICACFSIQQDDEIPGEAYCYALKARYVSSISLRFLIRMAYVPPQHLVESISASYLAYIQTLTDKMHLALTTLNLTTAQIELFSDAYLGIIDSLSVELLYGELFYERRLKAMLFLYRNMLLQHKKS